MLLKEVSYTQANAFIFEHSKNSNIEKYSYFKYLLLFLHCLKKLFNSVMAILNNFSLQCHIILQKSFQFADLLHKKHFFIYL